MELTFDPNQDFQIKAIESVAGLFEGQPRISVELSFALGTALAAIPNRLDLDEATVLQNLRAVQLEQELSADVALLPIEERIATEIGPKDIRFWNFSVEMETGTGKTYVYLRTAIELFRRFGLRKFIIVVPSVAVRRESWPTCVHRGGTMGVLRQPAVPLLRLRRW